MRSSKRDNNNMAGFAGLVAEILRAINGKKSHEDEVRLRRTMYDVMREQSTSAQDRAVIQNLMQLLETSIEKQQSELQSVVQDREVYKAQVDELSRKVETLMKKDQEATAKAELSAVAKTELRQLLETYKLEKMRRRYNEGPNREPEAKLPWADDLKKPYKMDPKQHSGGAYGKFDRQNKPGYQDHGRRRADGKDKFEMVDHSDCKPQYQRSQSHNKPYFNNPPKNENFQTFSVPDNYKGLPQQNLGPKNFPQGEYRDRGGSHQRGGRGGQPFNRGGGHQYDGNAAGFEKKQFPNKNGPPNQGQYNQRGQFHNRGQGRGQFHGRGNFHNKPPFQQNRDQASNKEDTKKSDQNANLSGLTPKELEMYAQLFLQFQQQQETLKKGQESSKDATEKSAFKKKKKRRKANKKKTETNTKVEKQESEESSSDDDDDDDDDETAEEALAVATTVQGAKKKTSTNTKPTKESASAAFDLFQGSGFDLSQIAGVDPKQEIKDIMMIGRVGDDIVPCVPKTVKELLEFKEQYPNAKPVIMVQK